MKKERLKFSHVILLLAISAALAILAGCSGNAKEAEPAVPVQIVQVERTTLQQKVTADAVLFPIAQSAIVPKISAPVKTFLVNRGSHVRKGQLLAVLENRDLAAAAQENKGAYTQAEAAYETTTAADLPQEMQKAQLDTQAAKQALDAQQKIFDSRQELVRQGALPRKELDQSAVDLTNARNLYELAKRHLDSLNAIGAQQTLKSAKGNLESAQGKFQGAAAQLGYSEIKSPINGVITDRTLYPGEMASTGIPLLTIMDISQIVARAHIPQAEAVLLKMGDNATIAASGTDQPINAKVVLVSPALDPNSTTVEVWVQAKNPKQALKPGTSVRLSMVSEIVPDALVVPASAVLTASDGSATVMAIGSDQRARQLAVRVGIRQDENVQILDGLKEGQSVVASGAYGLPDNTKVSVEAAKEKETAKEKGSDKPSAGEESSSKDSSKEEKP